VKVTEIFYSIEGEGIEIGKPEIFVRLAKCNLRCEWCDSKYTWENGIEMSVKEVLKEISRYPCKSVSITGGEPLLQREELLELIQQLKRMNYWIQINTNGTIFDEQIFQLVDLITMDCKCPSSKMNSDLTVLEKTKKLFNHKAQFKFIISNQKDYEYAKSIMSSLLPDALNLVLQPEWACRKFARKLVDMVKRDNLNVRIIIQQQKILWGAKRRV
jgi:7-carboxy-7-deazaguanine synthase